MTKIEIIGRSILTGIGIVLLACLSPVMFILYVLGMLAEQFFPAFDNLRSHFTSLLAQYHYKNLDK